MKHPIIHSLKMMLLAPLVVASLSAAPLEHHWKPIAKVPNNAIAIAASRETQNFLAIGSDEIDGTYSIFSLDHNNLRQGWVKVSSLSLPGTPRDLVYGLSHFFITGVNDQEHFVAVSSDAISWIVVPPQMSFPFIGIGSDGVESSIDLFPVSNAGFVAIGSDHFSLNAPHHRPLFRRDFHLMKKFAAAAANNDMFVAVTSDGMTFASPK